MSYQLGIDLGTTWTAAAIRRGDRVAMVQLSQRSVAVPSVVLLRDDDTILVGEPADRRAIHEPSRVAREFKRRIGDSTPLLLGGTPYSAEAVTARLLGWVVDEVTREEGGAPDELVLTHPANWGQYKLDLLAQAVMLARLDVPFRFLTEPEAAVIHYASQERIEPGTVVGAYDLGGGTFDAAVLRKTDDGFEFLGSPEGIERLGGIDFDEAVFQHVLRSLGVELDALDDEDPVLEAALQRLRLDCVAAKETLSTDSDTSIPVMLPNLQTEVRLTRAEFEAMIRPTLVDTISVTRRVIESAGIATDGLDRIVLIGGSSRIPVVSELLTAEFGVPIAVDAHPKNAVALGAALSAGTTTAGGEEPVVVAEPGGAAADGGETASADASPREAAPSEPTASLAAAESLAAAGSAGEGGRSGPPSGGGSADPGGAARPGPRGPSRIPAIVVGAALLLVVVVAAAVFLSGGDDGSASEPVDESPVADPDDEEPATTVSTSTSTSSSTTTTTSTSTTSTTTTTTTAAVVDRLTEGVRCEAVTELCIDIVDVSLDDEGELVIDWEANFVPDRSDGNHAHFFWSTQSPVAVGAGGGGEWEISDTQPHRAGTFGDAITSSRRPPDADICVTVANPDHSVRDPAIYQCWAYPAE